ncbi:MAG: YceI family protein [Ignavibacteriae bacterium]|nr:YceI family protein [Ignavibacteriota bacterium]MCB9248365.1 YceI family protein [Ignavibacteriales bacterium]
MKSLKIAILLLAAASFSFAQTNWSIDKSHSKIGFSVTHLVITEVEGKFKNFEAKITTANENFDGASIEFTADVNSIDTYNEKRDQHLMSDDFFNAEKFPKLIFKSKSFKKVDDKNYKLVGDLTIRDITKEVTLDAKYGGTITDPWGNTKAGFKIDGDINRFDYGLKWDAAIETGGLVVSKDVKLIINLELNKQK